MYGHDGTVKKGEYPENNKNFIFVKNVKQESISHHIITEKTKTHLTTVGKALQNSCYDHQMYTIQCTGYM